MQLVFKKLGSGFPLIILHGLYGSSDNWHSVGKELSRHFEVYLVDQRNHGNSDHEKEHSYRAMQADLEEFYVTHNLKKAIIIGHSMGGKTAMLFSLLHPDRIEKLVIVDIAPVSYKSLDKPQKHVLEHLNIMQAFLSIDIAKAQSRTEVEKEFELFVPDKNTRHFLLKNLKRNAAGKFQWAVNIEALNNSLPEMMNASDFDKITIEKEKMNFPVLFVRGEKSEYIMEEYISRIKELFPKADVVTIFDAGHWVHAEQPQLFLKTLSYFLLDEK